jgi:transposase
LPYRDVEKVLTGLFGMPFVPASAMAFSHAAAHHGNSLYEDLRDKIRAADVAHGDETHWRIDGKSAYLWYAGNPQVAFFHADPSRGGDVAVSIFGDAFGGNLVADSYPGYNPIHAQSRQACLAHLCCKAKEIAERIELMPERKQDSKAVGFCKALKKFFAICCRIDQRRKSGRVTFQAAKHHIPRLQRVLDALCRQPLAEEDAENLRQRITDPKRDAQNLFTFLKVKDMPPTNNHAEQSLRLPVIFRKICFGSRSLTGAQALAVNLSILTNRQTSAAATCRCIQNHPLERKGHADKHPLPPPKYARLGHIVT